MSDPVTFTLHYGAAEPLIIEGGDAVRLFEHAERFRCWHWVPPQNVETLDYLETLGCIERDPSDLAAYKFKYPKP